MAPPLGESSPPVSRFPDVSRREAEHRAEHAAGDRADERGDLEVDRGRAPCCRAACRRAARPMSRRPTTARRARRRRSRRVEERVAPRLVEVIDDRAEGALTLAPRAVAPPAGERARARRRSPPSSAPHSTGVWLAGSSACFVFCNTRTNVTAASDPRRSSPESASVRRGAVIFRCSLVIAGGACLSQTKRCRKSLDRAEDVDPTAVDERFVHVVRDHRQLVVHAVRAQQVDQSDHLREVDVAVVVALLEEHRRLPRRRSRRRPTSGTRAIVVSCALP